MRMQEYTGPHMKQIGLLILQPSPFCNIDCDYCYLADRASTKKMSLEVLHKTLDRVFESGMVGGQLSLVWHAGEPLAVPLSCLKIHSNAWASSTKKRTGRKRNGF